MRIKACVIMPCAVMLLATGCTKGADATKTTLYVEDDGKVTSAIVESLDKDYYDMDELEKWTIQEIESYNDDNTEDAVVLKKCEKEDGNAKVTLEYASMEDYSSFNHVDAFCGTITEAAEAGYDFGDELKSTKGKPSIGYTELEGNDDYYALITQEAQEIVLDNDILYASSNVKVNGAKATIDKDNRELVYIIYKP